MNVVTLVGNLTADVEVTYTSDGLAIASFSLAINEYHKNKEHVNFIPVKLFGKTAENAGNYLSRGKKASVTGNLHMESWDDKSGRKRSKLVVYGQTVEFLSPNAQNTQPQSNTRPSAQRQNTRRPNRARPQSRQQAAPVMDDQYYPEQGYEPQFDGNVPF